MQVAFIVKGLMYIKKILKFSNCNTFILTRQYLNNFTYMFIDYK